MDRRMGDGAGTGSQLVWADWNTRAWALPGLHAGDPNADPMDGQGERGTHPRAQCPRQQRPTAARVDQRRIGADATEGFGLRRATNAQMTTW